MGNVDVGKALWRREDLEVASKDRVSDAAQFRADMRIVLMENTVSW